MVKVAGIVGSLNSQSVSRKFLNETGKYFSDKVELSEIDYKDVPLVSSDSEYPKPESMLRVLKEVDEADALVVVVPEYNLSVPGVLKNLIDWLSRPLEPGQAKPTLDKPILVLSTSAGVSGGMVPQEQLRSVLNYLGASVMPQPRASFSLVYSKLDGEGNLALDDMSAGFLKQTVEAFEKYVGDFHAVR
jgi:chromate reductase